MGNSSTIDDYCENKDENVARDAKFISSINTLYFVSDDKSIVKYNKQMNRLMTSLTCKKTNYDFHRLNDKIEVITYLIERKLKGRTSHFNPLHRKILADISKDSIIQRYSKSFSATNVISDKDFNKFLLTINKVLDSKLKDSTLDEIDRVYFVTKKGSKESPNTKAGVNLDVVYTLEKMNKLNSDSFSINNPEDRAFYFTSLLKRNSKSVYNQKEVGFLKRITEEIAAEVGFQEFCSNKIYNEFKDVVGRIIYPEFYYNAETEPKKKKISNFFKKSYTCISDIVMKVPKKTTKEISNFFSSSYTKLCDVVKTVTPKPATVWKYTKVGAAVSTAVVTAVTAATIGYNLLKPNNIPSNYAAERPAIVLEDESASGRTLLSYAFMHGGDVNLKTIPASASTKIVHNVKSGESLTRIAKNYKVKTACLAEANNVKLETVNGKSWYALQPGQKVTIDDSCRTA